MRSPQRFPRPVFLCQLWALCFLPSPVRASDEGLVFQDPPGAVVFDTVNLRTVQAPGGTVPESCDADYRRGMERSLRGVWEQCQAIGKAEPSDCQRDLFSQCVQLGEGLRSMAAHTCSVMQGRARPLPENVAGAENQKKSELSTSGLNQDAHAALQALAAQLAADGKTLEAYKKRGDAALASMTCSLSSAASAYKGMQGRVASELSRAGSFVSALRRAKEAAARQVARNAVRSQAFALGLRSAGKASASTITMRDEKGAAASPQERAPEPAMALSLSVVQGAGAKAVMVPIFAGGEPSPAVLKGIALSPRSRYQLAALEPFSQEPTQELFTPVDFRAIRSLGRRALPEPDAYAYGAGGGMLAYGASGTSLPDGGELIDGEPEVDESPASPVAAAPAPPSTPDKRPSPAPAAAPAPGPPAAPLPPATVARPAIAPAPLPPAPKINGKVPGQDVIDRTGVTVSSSFTDQERAVIALGVSKIPPCQRQKLRGVSFRRMRLMTRPPGSRIPLQMGCFGPPKIVDVPRQAASQGGNCASGLYMNQQMQPPPGMKPVRGPTITLDPVCRNLGISVPLVVHESFHHIDIRLRVGQRFLREIVAQHDCCPVTKYAAMSHQEDFAETGRLMVLGSDHVQDAGMAKNPKACADRKIAAFRRLVSQGCQ